MQNSLNNLVIKRNIISLWNAVDTLHNEHITSSTIKTNNTMVNSNINTIKTEILNTVNTSLTSKSDVGHKHSISDVTDYVAPDLSPYAKTEDISKTYLTKSLAGETYSPIVHNHSISEVTDLSDKLDLKSDTGHNHDIDDITDLTKTLNGKSNTGHNHSISEVTDLSDKLDLKSDIGHTHSSSDIFDLEDELKEKSDVGHGHEIDDIKDLSTTISLLSTKAYVDDEISKKANSSHEHSISDITNLTNTISSINSSISTLNSGKSNVGHKHEIDDITDLSDTISSINSSISSLNSGKSDTGHKHEIDDITNLTKTLNGKSNTDHKHEIDDITDLTKTLNGKSNVGHEHVSSEITDLNDTISSALSPYAKTEDISKTYLTKSLAGETYSPITHNHSISDVEGLSTKIKSLEDDISGKADVGHKHEIDDITNLTKTLNGKSNTDHKHSISDVTDYVAPDLSPYAKTEDIKASYLTKSDAANTYLTSSTATSTYETIANVNTLSSNINTKFTKYYTSEEINAKLSALSTDISNTYETIENVNTKIKATNDKFANYYTTSDIDTKLSELSTNVENTYETKAIVTDKLSALSSDISNTYETKANVTSKLSALSTSFDTKLSKYTNTETLEKNYDDSSEVDAKISALSTNIANTYETIENVNTLSSDVNNKFTNYYTSEEINTKLSDLSANVEKTYETKENVTNRLSALSTSFDTKLSKYTNTETLEDNYYNKEYINTTLSGYTNTETLEKNYYNKSAIDEQLETKASASHTHTISEITDYSPPDLTPYAKSEDVDTNIAAVNKSISDLSSTINANYTDTETLEKNYYNKSAIDNQITTINSNISDLSSSINTNLSENYLTKSSASSTYETIENVNSIFTSISEDISTLKTKTQNQTASENETSFNGNIIANTINGVSISDQSNYTTMSFASIVRSDGGMDIGRYIDFHNMTSEGTLEDIDYNCRLDWNNNILNSSNTFTAPNIKSDNETRLQSTETKNTQQDERLTSIEADLTTKANTSHTHQISEIEDLSTKITSVDNSISDIQSNKVDKSTFNEYVVSSGEQISTINTTITSLTTKTYVDEQLSSKANASHTHVFKDITDLSDALEPYAKSIDTLNSGKSDIDHKHISSEITDLNDTITTALSPYAKSEDVNNSISTINTSLSNYLTKSEANTYLSKSDASSTYLTSVTASKTYSPITHEHTSSEITDLNDTLSPYAKSADVNKAISDINTNKLDTYKFDKYIESNDKALATKADSVHTHSISEISELGTSLSNKADINHTHTISDISDLTETLENKLTAPLSSTPSVKSCKATYNSADSSAYNLHFDITYTFTDSSYIACFNTSVSDKSIFTLSFNYTQSSSSSTYTTTLYIRSTTNDAYEIYADKTDYITIAGYTINPGTLKFNLIFSISSDTAITYNNISAFTYNDTIFTTYRKYDGILLADNISPNINERINNKADKSHQHFTKDIVGLPEVLSAVSWTGHTHTVSEVDGLNTKLDEMKTAIISAIYPVGSVYYSVNNTSPATLFGIGTWQHLPSSKYTRIADSSSDVSSISTGGSDNITVNNLPAHYHTTTTYDCIGSDDINSDGIVQFQQDMNQWIKEDVATVMGGTLSGGGVTRKTIVHSGTEQGPYEIGVSFSEKAPSGETWISQWRECKNPGICYGIYQIPTGLAGNSDAFYPSYVELHAWVRTA